MKIITWRLEKTQGNNKLLWKKCLPAIKRNKTFWSKQVIPRTNAGEVFIFFLQLLPLKVYETFLFRHSKIVGKIIWSVTFPQKRRSNKYRSWKPNLAFPNLILVWYTKVKFLFEKSQFKRLIVFSHNFVAHKNKVFGYNFDATSKIEINWIWNNWGKCKIFLKEIVALNN